jgi:hypothetical protein
MDKRKLIQIIEKELEELKVITEEVSENEKDTGLIIEIALGKARVLCNEIELLRTLSVNEKADQVSGDEDEPNDNDEASDVNISDPELEIAEPQDEDENTTFSPDEFDETDTIEEVEEDDLTDEDDELDDEDIAIEDEETGKEELIEFEHGTSLTTEEDETSEQPVSKIEYKINTQLGFREIHMDDADDELISTKTAPISTATERPVIREIPKPQDPAPDKKAVAESFQKGPTLNEAIGETKTSETTLNTGPITSLRAAIGLNDRFLFVREIFGNNTEKYNKIIDHLDKLETIQQAVEYLKSQLTLQKNDTSMKFVELLKRRFTK